MGRVSKKTPESMVKDIRKNTRRLFTSEQKVLIVMEALRAFIEFSRFYTSKSFCLVLLSLY